MKGVKKICYGLSLVFSITLGLLLNASLDVSALKYDINTIPLWSPGGLYSSFPTNDLGGFHIWSSDDFDTSISNQQHTHIFWQPVVNSRPHGGPNVPFDGTCEVPEDKRPGHGWQQTPRISTSNGVTELDYSFYVAPLTDCMSYNPLSNPSSTAFRNLTDLDIPNRELISSNLPSRFMTDSFYVFDSRNEAGVYTSSKFNFHDLYGLTNLPSRIDKITIPLGPTRGEVISALTPSTPIEFDGEFITNFKSRDGAFADTTSATLHIWTYDPDWYGGSGGPGNNEIVSSCEIYSYNEDDPSTDWPFTFLHYNCRATLWDSDHWTSGTYPYMSLVLDLDYRNSNSQFQLFSIDHSLTITNNDPTPAGNFNNDPVGGNPDYAPGSALISSNANPDLDTSLINLFNFNIANPFQPIFSMFSPDDSCASIPTLAGMLHSPSSTVCPWFDSQTRAILTPVLSLSSMMLIFGFIVRWLGASSGNMFIDNDIKDTGSSFSLRNKYGRKK